MARYARLTTMRFQPEREADDQAQVASNRRQAVAMVDRAAKEGSDLVHMQEVVTQRYVKDMCAFAEPIPGPTTDAVGEACRRNKCYAIATTVQEEGGKLYNASALIGRDGEVVGVYHKMCPTNAELEWGITPGSDAPVFQTDFGRVGMSICFDMNFYTVGERLFENGAQLVCWSSAYEAGRQLQFWSMEFGFYLMSANYFWRNEIIDMNGYPLARTDPYLPIASVDVNFDREMFHVGGLYDDHLNYAEWEAIRCKYGSGVTMIIHPEEKFTLASEMDDVSIEGIIEEFDLMPWREHRPAALARIQEYRERA